MRVIGGVGAVLTGPGLHRDEHELLEARTGGKCRAPRKGARVAILPARDARATPPQELAGEEAVAKRAEGPLVFSTVSVDKIGVMISTK